MIHDLYSEDMDNDDADNYSSPKAAKKDADEKLNPVIEESHEYSVTPSRIV